MTTIHVSEITWKNLNQIKQLGESMDDVVVRLLRLYGESDDEISDTREFDAVLDEFCELQKGIDDIIEQSRASYAKEIS